MRSTSVAWCVMHICFDCFDQAVLIQAPELDHRYLLLVYQLLWYRLFRYHEERVPDLGQNYICCQAPNHLKSLVSA